MTLSAVFDQCDVSVSANLRKLFDLTGRAIQMSQNHCLNARIKSFFHRICAKTERAFADIAIAGGGSDGERGYCTVHSSIRREEDLVAGSDPHST